MAFATRLTALFDIRHPILAGGLMWLSDARYVASVVNAGGMGFLTPRSYPDLDSFAAALDDCGRLSEGRPFGVNLTISRSRNNAYVSDWLRVALRRGVRYFETAGDAPHEVVRAIHSGGGVVIHKCPKLRHALSAQEMGVDAVAIVGPEAGGHPGVANVPAMVVGALARDRLRVPYAIGGGIGSGAQIVAALAVGADAVVMGSRLLVADEVPAHAAYKARVLEMNEDSSAVCFAGSQQLGGAWRVMANRTALEVQRREAAGKREFEDFSDLVVGAIARDACYRDGDTERGMLSMGPGAAFADRAESMTAIIARIMEEASQTVSRLAQLAIDVERAA